jgi:hypothetical protein
MTFRELRAVEGLENAEDFLNNMLDKYEDEYPSREELEALMACICNVKKDIKA